MTELGIVPKIVKLPGDDLLPDIGGLEMERGIDSEKIDRGVFKPGPRAERAAQGPASRRRHSENCRLIRMISDALVIPSK